MGAFQNILMFAVLMFCYHFIFQTQYSMDALYNTLNMIYFFFFMDHVKEVNKQNKYVVTLQ